MTISKRNTVLSLILTFISLSMLQAQSFGGRVIASSGGEPIPFANIMVKGSSIGVATDMDGNFSLNIPQKIKKPIVIISAVGYAHKEISTSHLSSSKTNTITLITQEYNIDEVDVQAESKVLYGAIKTCNQSIANNYITEPYSCDFTYSNNGKTAKGTITDNTGYQRTTFKGSYRKVNYAFTPNENKENNVPYFAGKTNMEDLLSFDLVRTIGNVIDKQNVYDFKLEIDTNNTNPNLWIIHFSNDTPKLYNTGDAHASSYEGELYINKKNYAIIKVVVRGTSSKRSPNGKAIYVTDKSSNYTSSHNYEVTTTYISEGGKLRMDKIIMAESFTDTSGQEKKVMSSLSIDKQKDDVVKIKGRDYFVKNL